MLFGIVCCRNSINLGDEIQSLAAKYLLQELGIKPTFYYDRDKGDLYSLEGHQKLIIDPKIRYHVIFNGWFDGNYCKFPLPVYIYPLFISFHVNETIKDKSYNWLDPHRKHFMSLADPCYKKFYSKSIGCRDIHTYNKFFLSGYKNIYLSGCLTMTLNNTQKEGRKGIYLVDVDRKDIENDVSKIILDKSQKLTHVFPGDPTDESGKFIGAEKLLSIYKQAELVITSRLHCVIPCISFNTPVLFFHHNMQDVRFAGLIDLVPVIGRDVVWTNLNTTLPNPWLSQATLIRKNIKEWVDHIISKEKKKKSKVSKIFSLFTKKRRIVS